MIIRWTGLSLLSCVSLQSDLRLNARQDWKRVSRYLKERKWDAILPVDVDSDCLGVDSDCLDVDNECVDVACDCVDVACLA